MTKRAGILAILVLIVCLFLLISSPAQAQGGLNIIQSSAQVNFPLQLSFSLSAESDADIFDVRLCYVVDQEGFAEVTSEVYVEFVPSTQVSVDWTLEMVKIGGLAPGSTLEYWWVVRDTSGDEVKTAPAEVQFTDNRFPWRSLTEGEVTVYWYEGDDSFAAELMSSAQQALARLAEDTGARLEKPAELYIYASTQDLVGALIYPQEWTGGVAFTRFGIISIGISPDKLSWGKSAIAHEMAHLVIHQMTLNPYIGLPTWLDEGLAMYAEELLSPTYASRLYRAVNEDSLISVRSLSSPFSAETEAAVLSYAESYSLVEFLINRYGQAKMLELLNTFRQGSGYDSALKNVYGFDTEGLDAKWREYVAEQYLPPAAEEEEGLHPALITILSALATWLVLGLALFAESRTWRRVP